MKFKRIVNEYITVASNQKDVGEIYIEGDIVDDKWWDNEVSPKSVRDALKDAGSAKTLNININSYGGSCIAGNAIVAIIDEYRAKNNSTVNVKIAGIAASMGSGIAMVGDHVSMASNSLFMVHKPSTWACGNATDLEKTVEVLNKTEETLVRNYMRKFKGTEEELRDLMAEETWLTAEEALEWGFIDEITDGVEIAASAKGVRINNKVFNDRMVDFIKEKYPNVNIEDKEEPVLEYDAKLNDFGIDEERFKAFDMESEKVMAVASIVKDKLAVEPEAPFVTKDAVCEALGLEDVTAEELLNLAKAGAVPKDTKEADKAKAYDKIVNHEREKALANAIRAEGPTTNEKILKRMLDALDYDDIVEQSEKWSKMAQDALCAGRRVSIEETSYHNDSEINPKDYLIG